MRNLIKKPSKIISEFLILGKKLIYRTSLEQEGTNIFIYDLPEMLENSSVNVRTEGGIMKIQSNYLLYQDLNRNLFQFDISNKISLLRNLAKEEWRISLNVGYEGKYLICYKGRILEREYGIYDLQSDEIILYGKGNLFGLNVDNIVYLNNKNNIECLSIIKNSILWHFSLSDHGRWYNEFDKKWEEGRVEHFAGVANGVLWVNINSGTIVGLNIETGELKHLFTKPNKVIGTATKPHQQSPHFWLNYDEKRNILFGFHYDVFGEIDLNESESTLTFYILEDCTKHQAFCPNLERYCYDDNYFYYLDAFNGKIGVINRNTKNLDWVYSFPDGSTTGILMKIEVSENHLFVLDSGGTLHIFEREKVA